MKYWWFLVVSFSGKESGQPMKTFAETQHKKLAFMPFMEMKLIRQGRHVHVLTESHVYM